MKQWTRIDTSHSSCTGSSTIQNTNTFCRRFWSTVKNYSDWRISSKCSNKKLSREASLCHKFYHQKKRSWTKKPPNLQMPTAGWSSWTLVCRKKHSKRTSPTSSLNQKSSLISVQISTSMRLWQFSRLNVLKMPLIPLNWWNLRKRLTACSAPMRLT